MTVQPPVRLRADARRNRDQIVAAAKVVFVESGPDVPMEEIARRAEVGVGTLYRRFPDRESLIRAVAHESMRAVLDDARAAAAEEPTAWEALVRLLRWSRDLRLSIRLVLSARSWPATRNEPETRHFRTEIMAVLEDLVHRAQAEGALRADVGAGDVAVLMSLLLRPHFASSDEATERILDRALVVMLDGLSARPGSPLPGPAVSAADLGRLGSARR